MKTKDRILESLAGQPRTATELARILGVSRQAVSKHLRDLIASGKVLKKGVTKGAQFRLMMPGEKRLPEKRYVKKLPLRGLEEDQVLRSAASA